MGLVLLSGMIRRLSTLNVFGTKGCTLKEDQPLRQLLNLFFYHFNRSKPTYKSQRIKLLDVIAHAIN